MQHFQTGFVLGLAKQVRGNMESNHYGLAWHNNKWRYFEKYQPIREGKNKGAYWIVFPEGMKLIHSDQIKRFPGQLSLLDE